MVIPSGGSQGSRTISCTRIQNYCIMVVFDEARSSVVVDEPIAMGGSGLGPDPFALLLAALGSDTITSLTGAARRDGIPMESVAVNLHCEQNEYVGGASDPNRQNLRLTSIAMEIQVGGWLTPEHEERLFNAARSSPLLNTFSASLEIKTTLINAMERSRLS